MGSKWQLRLLSADYFLLLGIATTCSASKTPKYRFSLQNYHFRFKFFFDQNLDFVLGFVNYLAGSGKQIEANDFTAGGGTDQGIRGALQTSITNKMLNIRG